MESVRPCACKGVRTCLLCEKEFNIQKPDIIAEFKRAPCYVYCPQCDKAWPGWDWDVIRNHPNHSGDPIAYSGVYIKIRITHTIFPTNSKVQRRGASMENFLTTDEMESLQQDLDSLPWESSQSGRRKQNYGPKCNFKKRRLRTGDFNGFPRNTKFVQERLKDHEILRDFQTIEQCSLEYTQETGASIDPHIDDCWIWGERIVTVNVTGDSMLTMTPYNGARNRYNLQDVDTYAPVVDLQKIRNDNSVVRQNGKLPDPPESAVVRLPMPAGSLMVLYGAARYDWEHAVLREDVNHRRVCIAYREFTPPYLGEGAKSDEAKEILAKAVNFW